MLEEGVEVERLKDGWHILRQTRQPNLALSIRKNEAGRGWVKIPDLVNISYTGTYPDFRRRHGGEGS